MTHSLSSPDYLRTRTAYHHLVHTLAGALPPPASDTAEDRHRRDTAAIAQVAALCPANVAEATLAAQYVAASAQAMECLRLTHAPRTPGHLTLKCNAQAALMMRQSQGAMGMLLRMQAARQSRETNDETAGNAAWTEHRAIQIMTGALTEPAAAPAEHAPQDAPDPGPCLHPHPDPGPDPDPDPDPGPDPDRGPDHDPDPGPDTGPDVGLDTGPAPGSDTDPDAGPPPLRSAEPTIPGPLAAAEAYAIIYPVRARIIRRLGRVPDNPDFGPPEEDVVRLIVQGQTPALRALDQRMG
jgi:hypothetical protein